VWKGYALSALAGLFLLTSASADERSSAWEGRDKADLIEKYGRPQYVVSDERSGQVLVYIPLDTVSKVAAASSGVLPSFSSLAALDAFRMFFVDAAGKIYRVESKGGSFRWTPPWWW
jgi:hypothetical protein